MLTQVKCSSCGRENKITTYQSINVKDNPELKGNVKDGSLFVWQCPNCGQMNLAVYQTLYHDPEERLMIWLLPDGGMPDAELSAVEKHLEAIAGQMGSEEGGLEGYVLRRVSDVGSLIEKVNIHDAGLDDAVMEMCKYITKMELAEKESNKDRAKAIADAPFKFYKMDGADNDITFSYPFDGQMQGVQIGFNVYEDCRGILQRNPSARPGAGFTKVDAEWLATRMR
ncbi:MAG: CpXC domain-containing protein [Candidatus Cryptobacteroides sp.]|nr:CpXC domain-containing protein [Bacteroidales bacterium]